MPKSSCALLRHLWRVGEIQFYGSLWVDGPTMANISRTPGMTNKIESLSRRVVLFGLARAFAGETARAQFDAPPPLRTSSSQFIELQPRAIAPQVILQRLDGKSIPLDASRGKVILLSFWATWCPPCRRELPTLERLQRTFDSRKFEIVAVSVDTSGQLTVRRFLDRLGVKHLPVYLDPDGRIAERAHQETGAPFPLYGMPITYVIDRSGSVVGYVTGEVDWLSAEAIAFLKYFIDG
jgi:thiol-disulfide isomerase/thioredoxin